MDLDEAVEVLERHKQLPAAERQAAMDDPQSQYWLAKARGDAYLTNLRDQEEQEARAKQQADAVERQRKEAQRVRNDRVRLLTTTLDQAIGLLAAVDSVTVLDATEVRRIAAFDATGAGLSAELGVEWSITTPDYGQAVAAWMRGERSTLAAARQAQRDVMVGAL